MHNSGNNGNGARAFDCLHDLADFAARLGRSKLTARRVIEADPELRAAARCFLGTVWLPASALEAWWERQPKFNEFVPRVMPRVMPRAIGARSFSKVVAARTEGEARRKVEGLP